MRGRSALLGMFLGALAVGCGDSGIQTIVIGGVPDGSVGEDAKGDTDGATGDSGGDMGGDAGRVDGVVEEVETLCPLGGDGFGCPCLEHDDCSSGWCIEGPEGPICSKECIEDCDHPDYVCRIVVTGGVDQVSLCIPKFNRPCDPCSADAQCPSGTCLELDGEGRCGVTCEDQGDCEEGFECLGDPQGVKVGQWCQPVGGSCTCTIDDIEKPRTCTKSNEHGTCYGVELCEPGVGWGACSATEPAVEVCDGLDNDCDGRLDTLDDIEPPGPCEETNTWGTCAGSWACVDEGAGIGWVCNAPVPSEEICDGLDNDCEGGADEDFRNADGIYVDQDNCGACGISCDGAIPNASAHCVVGGNSARCEVLACDPGFYKGGPQVCFPVEDASCNPCETDANCGSGSDRCLMLAEGGFCGRDCGPDNSYGLPEGECNPGFACATLPDGARQCRPISGSCSCMPGDGGKVRACIRENESGICYGQETCDESQGWVGCTAGEPAPEVCNQADDNCNAIVDDLPGRGDPCTLDNAAGSCPGLLGCAPGLDDLQCLGDTPTVEVCNGLDDDCSGQTDDNLSAPACGLQQGVCAGSHQMCSGSAGWLPCTGPEYGDGYEQVELTCDGLDNDCDGGTDDDLPPYPCPNQQGVCAGSIRACDSASGSWVACGGAQYGANYEATESTCDQLDNDCDGTTDEGWTTGGRYERDDACGNCFTDCTEIYDKPNAYGVCATGAGGAACQLSCCTVGDGNASCDGVYEYFDLNAVPDDGCEFRLDPDAIYVSVNDPAASDANGCGRGPSGTGAGNFPCASIAAGIGEAGADGRSAVLVGNGTYTEIVTVAAGIDLEGGFRSDTWEQRIESSSTILRGADAGGHTKTLIAEDISLPTRVEGFVIEGVANFAPSGNSYAVWVSNCGAGFTLAHNEIAGGIGAPGAAGQSGVEGDDGAAGAEGEDTIQLDDMALAACLSDSTTPGNQGFEGDGGRTSCGGQPTDGGDGAAAFCPNMNDQQPTGEEGTVAPGGALAGGGGAGGHDRRSSNCSTYQSGGFTAEAFPGTDGHDGADGQAGQGCPAGSNGGNVVAGDWVGTDGADGADGRPGSGGGGGGAGGGADRADSCTGIGDALGGSGGGGGAGACNGTGAAGGRHGGGAFAIFVSFDAPTSSYPAITDNDIVRGIGGRGGNGGVGGAGGLGGDGANGGIATGPWDYAMGSGGRGGQGGDGGAGGGGGGGCGGVSYGVYVHNFAAASPPDYDTANAFYGGGEGGPGGEGGSSLGASGTVGAQGAWADHNL